MEIHQHQGLQKLNFETSGASRVTPKDIDALLLGDAAQATLVFVNGAYRADLSRGEVETGLEALSFREGIARYPTLMRERLGSLAGFDAKPDWSFTALNTAFFSDGALLVVPRNTDGGVLHVLHIQDPSGGLTSSHPRSLIVLEPNSAATVIQTFATVGDDAAFTNAVTEVVVGDGARLAHVVWAHEGPSAYHVGRTEIDVGRDASYVGTSVWTGGLWSRLDTDVRFTATGGECELNGLYIGGGKQHIDHHTCVDHAVPNCRSDQLYKGVLGGSSKAVFNGRIHIHADAQRSDSAMSNRNLLLTDLASINTKPELEIYADDVKASHVHDRWTSG